ncbi:MAG: fimbrial protein pilin [Candidatus Moranbacteria bacterium GW2011_GWC2_37_73]|nr:MAG: fimbrial protein pilin [Parcubacteria group bacterium GW2011_GWC1_36_108]KKQ00770.1 MAG: fimbrial protein pilin [Candidatus Moranbacteria bacterium GW2011_GWD1_36_198]KKQ02231.1 MAG: fimbrial protein pilin [Candidatus Moranbacteria bacterium GW2011_GWD2_36_198]KKQ39696.1 MAG: fimbrial protein pilin [Candidatus Moranbacteria bacterium GW2011_GWC2_37_73]
MQKKAFTLIELMLVIAIIGILAGVVLVSTGSSIDKSKTASAITTLSSVLPEIVTCQDDGAGLNAYNVASKICNDASHSVLWPNVNAKTGYTVTAAAATNAQISTYTFTATKSGQPTITCSYANNSCSTP